MPPCLHISSEKNSWTLLGALEKLSSMSAFLHSPLTRPSTFPNLPPDAVSYLSSIVLQHCKCFGRNWCGQSVQKVFGAVTSCLGKFVTESVPLAWDRGSCVSTRSCRAEPFSLFLYFLSPGKPKPWGLKGGRREHGKVGVGGLFCLGCAWDVLSPWLGICGGRRWRDEKNLTAKVGTVREKDPWWMRSAKSWCTSSPGQCVGIKRRFLFARTIKNSGERAEGGGGRDEGEVGEGDPGERVSEDWEWEIGEISGWNVSTSSSSPREKEKLRLSNGLEPWREAEAPSELSEMRLWNVDPDRPEGQYFMW